MTRSEMPRISCPRPWQVLSTSFRLHRHIQSWSALAATYDLSKVAQCLPGAQARAGFAVGVCTVRMPDGIDLSRTTWPIKSL